MNGRLRLQAKVAVITGSTRGLGRAIAEAYAREGASVVVSSRREEAVATAAGELQANGWRAIGAVCDVTDAAQVEALAARAAQEFGQIDVWVNNAGVTAPWSRTLDVARGDFLRVVETNILGGYYGSVTALRQMLPRRSGKIINLLGLGARGPAPFANAYGPSKAWLRAFTLALAREYRESGVGIFAFAPGMVLTEMLTDLRMIGPEARHAARLLPFALRVLARPPEVAAARAVWIASAATDGLTGKVFETRRLRRLAHGLAREAWRMLARRPQVEIPLTIDYSEEPRAPRDE
jgi:NAD(P)-dependent dehydrogenase (short-subunit alcohol dehydrogenase family)